jgi:hypothetical protein
MFGSGMTALVVHRHIDDIAFGLATVQIGASLIVGAHIIE